MAPNEACNKRQRAGEKEPKSYQALRTCNTKHRFAQPRQTPFERWFGRVDELVRRGVEREKYQRREEADDPARFFDARM